MRLRPNRSSTASEAGSPNAPAGFFDNMADTMLNAFSKVHKPDKRFIEVTERASKLDEDLTHVEKIIARVARREGDIEQDYINFIFVCVYLCVRVSGLVQQFRRSLR